MITALSEPAVHAVDACAQVRPIRRVAVAVQCGEGGDFAFHAVDGDDAALTWTGTLQAATADAAVLDVFVRIRMEVDPLDRIRFLVDLPRGSLLWIHQDEVRGALPRCTVQGPGPRDAELMAAAAAGLSPGPASGEPMETARLMLPPLMRPPLMLPTPTRPPTSTPERVPGPRDGAASWPRPGSCCCPERCRSCSVSA